MSHHVHSDAGPRHTPFQQKDGGQVILIFFKRLMLLFKRSFFLCNCNTKSFAPFSINILKNSILRYIFIFLLPPSLDTMHLLLILLMFFRTTIARHLLSDQSDPFNRNPLTMDQVIISRL